MYDQDDFENKNNKLLVVSFYMWQSKIYTSKGLTSNIVLCPECGAFLYWICKGK